MGQLMSTQRYSVIQRFHQVQLHVALQVGVTTNANEGKHLLHLQVIS
jgi:hypothetical protein